MENHIFNVRGATTPLWSFSTREKSSQYFQNLKAIGANSVIIDFHLLTDSLSSSNVQWQHSLVRSNLQVAIAEAGKSGLDVWLKPIVLIGEGSGLNWAKLDPTNKEQWFSSYQSILLDVLSLDNVNTVSHLLLTNELKTLTTSSENIPYWQKLIQRVRETSDLELGFNAGGLLGGSQGTSEFENIQSELYSLVDFVGISAYPRITGSNLEEYSNGWTSDSRGNNLIEILQKFYLENNKDIYFTELGSPAVAGGNTTYYSGDQIVLDKQDPTLFFQAASDVISDNLSGIVKGVFTYAWSLSDEEAKPNGHFFVNHQPALAIIADWYGNGRIINTIKKGTDLSDFIYASDYDDHIYMGLGADTIYSFKGNDFIDTNIIGSENSYNEISFSIQSSILDGEAAKLEFILNGQSRGTVSLAPDIAGYFASFGDQPYTTVQDFVFNIDKLSTIESVEIYHRNDRYEGFGRDLNAEVMDLQINSISLLKEHGAYYSESQPNSIATSGWLMFQSGKLVFDPSSINTIINKRDNNQIDGGLGRDTIKYYYDLAEISISVLSNKSVQVVKPDGGIDSLNNVERLQGNDLSLAFDIEGNAGQAYRIYEAAFNRDPDPHGLGYWISQFDKGMGLIEISSRFIDSNEFKSIYGTNPTNETFITNLYLNVLDRVPDNSGLDWWVDQLDNNSEKTWKKVLADFSESPENIENNRLELVGGVEYISYDVA